jgi:hypothetical protein
MAERRRGDPRVFSPLFQNNIQVWAVLSNVKLGAESFISHLFLLIWVLREKGGISFQSTRKQRNFFVRNTTSVYLDRTKQTHKITLRGKELDFLFIYLETERSVTGAQKWCSTKGSLNQIIPNLSHSNRHLHFNYDCSRGNAVGIATGLGLDDQWVWVRVPVGSRIFSTSSTPALGPT